MLPYLKEKICSIRSSENPAQVQFCDLGTGPALTRPASASPGRRLGLGAGPPPGLASGVLGQEPCATSTTGHVPGRPSSLVDSLVLSKLGRLKLVWVPMPLKLTTGDRTSHSVQTRQLLRCKSMVLLKFTETMGFSNQAAASQPSPALTSSLLITTGSGGKKKKKG